MTAESFPITSGCQDHYSLLNSRCGEILVASFAFDDAGQSRSHSYAQDLETWIAALDSRPEVELLKSALEVYQFGLLTVLQGLYRQSFMSLRSFIELALGAVHFSGSELHLRQWLGDERDLSWQRIVDKDSGVFSAGFAKAFFAEAVEVAPEYDQIAGAVYRECSEYIHGNSLRISALPSGLQFDSAAFSSWHEIAESAYLVVTFALCVRYLKFLDDRSRNALEAVILDVVGHVPAIRAFYGAPVESG